MTKEYTTCLQIQLENKQVLKVTPDHLVFVKSSGYIKAQYLERGDFCCAVYDGKVKLIKVEEIVNCAKVYNVYDIKVQDNNNFFANNILVHNCGEIPMNPGSSCLLFVQNLKSYVINAFTKEAKFDFERLKKNTRKSMRLADDMVEIEKEKIKNIISKIESDNEPEHIKATEIKLWQSIYDILVKGRRVGVGVSSLADTIAMMGFKYGDNDSLCLVDDIMRTIHFTQMDEQAELAKERGPFPCWNWEKEKSSVYITMLPEATQEKIEKYGRRNISTSTCSPCGTISALFRSSAGSGIEPLYEMSFKRRKKLSSGEEKKGTTFTTDAEGVKWMEIDIEHFGVQQWKNVTSKTDVKESPYFGCTAKDINWKNKLQMQSIIQKYITHSISNCVKGDSLIDTDKGLFYIEELADFNNIKEDSFEKNISFDGKVLNKNNKRVKITDFYNNGVKEVFEIVLTNGLKLRCTYNEKLYVFNEESGTYNWKTVAELAEGERINIKLCNSQII